MLILQNLKNYSSIVRLLNEIKGLKGNFNIPLYHVP